jgi:outer membrane cobalamin receptor
MRCMGSVSFRLEVMAATLVTTLAILAGPAAAASVTGTVVDRGGGPVEFATVAVPALRRGTVTGADGRFSLDLPEGRYEILIAQIGYERQRVTIDAGAAGAPLRIVLVEEPVPVAQVNVSASSFGKAGETEGAVVRRMDIYTTPGGAADIFQSLRALPGINAPNEGAALYVRGGDPRETLVRLDGGSIGHPYHFEGASGGLFSSLDTYMLKSAFFSSGGFSAKYGGALSGVLDIETQDPLNLRTVTMGANMAGGSASGAWALVPDRLSIIGSYRRANPALLFRLYGSASEYETTPSSQDLMQRLQYRYSSSGRTSVTWAETASEARLSVDHLNTRSEASQSASNRLVAWNLQDVLLGRIAVRAQAAYQGYANDLAFGPIRLDQREHNGQFNMDAVWPLGPRHELSFGANLERLESRVAGVTVDDSTDYAGGAPLREIATRTNVTRPGFYVEDKLRLIGTLYATMGARFDHASVPGEWTADPRAGVALRVGEHQTVRVATGRYHQLADPALMDPVYGNPRLRPLSADHVIAGYEWSSEFGTVRIEGFRKDYRGLVTQDSVSFYANGGHGYARGVDLFVQGTYERLSGWVSYGYLDSKRMEGDDPRQLPSSFGVPHSVTLVGKYQATSKLQLGMKLNITTGAAWTPVVAANYDASRDLWRPVYAENNSARLPTYRRLDLRLTRLFSLPAAGGLPESSVCVLYIEGLNVLNTRNVLDVVYSEDYSEARRTESYFGRRMLVAGFALSW